MVYLNFAWVPEGPNVLLELCLGPGGTQMFIVMLLKNYYGSSGAECCAAYTSGARNLVEAGSMSVKNLRDTN
jgi:hypothetical protein